MMKIFSWLNRHKILLAIGITSGIAIGTMAITPIREFIMDITKLKRDKLKATMNRLKKITFPPNLTAIDKVKVWSDIVGIPDSLGYALVTQESEGNHKAYRYEAHIKDASYGLGQILCGTAKSIAVRYGEKITSCDDLYNVDKNLKYSFTFLKDRLSQWENNSTVDFSAIKKAYNKYCLNNKYNPVKGLSELDAIAKDPKRRQYFLALACYNGGPGAVKYSTKYKIWQAVGQAVFYGVMVLRHFDEFELAKQ